MEKLKEAMDIIHQQVKKSAPKMEMLVDEAKRHATQVQAITADIQSHPYFRELDDDAGGVNMSRVRAGPVHRGALSQGLRAGQYAEEALEIIKSDKDLSESGELFAFNP